MRCKGKINHLHKKTEAEGLPVSVVDAVDAGLERIPDAAPAVNSFYRFPENDPSTLTGRERIFKTKDAVQLLVELKQEGRDPTPEEKEILAGYTGWDTSARHSKTDFEYFFDNLTSPENEKFVTSLRKNAARYAGDQSRPVSKDVAQTVWKILAHLDVDTSRVLDTRIGTGAFLGYMPDELRHKNEVIVGVDDDATATEISKILFPVATIYDKDFAVDETLPRDYFDLVLGNMTPDNASRFGQYIPPEEIIGETIKKAITKTKPGGVVVFVVPNNFMDDNEIALEKRRDISRVADLECAVRMPNPTGGYNPTDILIFRRREEYADYKLNEYPAWTRTKNVYQNNEKFRGNLEINSYFANNPDFVFGKSLSPKDYDNHALNMSPLDEPLNASISRVLGSLKTRNESWKTTRRCPVCGAFMKDVCENPNCPTRRRPLQKAQETIGAWQIDENGKIYRKLGDIVQEHPAYTLSGKRGKQAKEDLERLSAMLVLREQAQKVLDLNLNGTDDDQLQAEIEKLNDLYGQFTSRFGVLHLEENVKAMAGDVSLAFLLTLEDNYNEDAKTADKAPILCRRIIKETSTPTPPLDMTDALLATIAEMGNLDIGRVAWLMGEDDVDRVRDMLVEEELVYATPDGQYVLANEYLSGNVREKLVQARKIAQFDKTYLKNVRALEEVLPEWVTIEDIDLAMGSNVIDPDFVAAFIREKLKVSFDVHYIPNTAEWVVTPANVSGWENRGKNSIENTQIYGNSDFDALTLIRMALNGKKPTVYTTVDGKKVIDTERTVAARELQERLQEEFTEFIKSRYEEEVEKKYNEQFNSEVPRKYNGESLTLPGMSENMPPLRPYQKDVIRRIVDGGNTLVAHAVGAGKSFSMIGAGMELKRLGKRNKIMHVVMNSMLEQYASDFYRMYPAANILAVNSEDLNEENYDMTMKRIAEGDWDAVIITHSAFERIQVSVETRIGVLEDEINALNQQRAFATDKRQQAKIDKQIDKLAAEIERLKKVGQKDGRMMWEGLKVDQIFVDEADRYKNLAVKSRRASGNQIPGIGVAPSARAENLFLKTRSMQKQFGEGKGVVFATGTPISNSLVELYNLQRFLDYEYLQKKGISNFDAWANLFADTVADLEMKPSGDGYEIKTRIAKFRNVLELRRQIQRFADAQMDLDKLGVQRPKLFGDKTEVISVDLTPEQAEYFRKLGERADNLKYVSPEQDNMLKITGDGRKAALDLRLVDPKYPDNPNSKLNRAVANICDIYKKTTGVSLEGVGDNQNLTQVIFCDMGTPKEGEFNIYDDIKQKLVKMGVPENEIAFIQDYKKDEEKFQLFQDFNEGKVRILIGSTEMIGAGVNIQKRLFAAHHLDTPWRPRDIEQRNGRILRPKNLNKVVRIFQYVTAGSPDAYSWQMLERKRKPIGQIFSADETEFTSRTIEDVDSAVLSYAEIKAIASGNPLLAEQVRVTAEFNKVASARAAFMNRKKKLAAQLNRSSEVLQRTRSEYEKRVMAASMIADRFRLRQDDRERMRKQIRAMEARLAELRTKSGVEGERAKLQNEYERMRIRYENLSGFSFTLPEGEMTSDSTQVAKRLVELETELANSPTDARIKAGEYLGLEWYLRKENGRHYLEIDFGTKIAPYAISPSKGRYVFDNSTPNTSLQEIIQDIQSMPSWVERASREIPALEREIAAIEDALNEPFRQEGLYRELARQKREIDVQVQAIADKHNEQIIPDAIG